jgi:hypothetical protein
MNRDQLTFVFRHQVLEDANKLVRAGAELSLAQANVVLEVTRSKRCKQWPNGDHHYSSGDSDADFLMADVVIPETVELSAIRVVREASHAGSTIKRKGRIQLGWLRDKAHVLAVKGGLKTKAEIIRELRTLYATEFPDQSPPSEGNKDLRKIVNEALANAGQ